MTAFTRPTTLPPGLRPGGRFASWRPARPRYVVADVDGTLIGAGTTASPRVAAAVADARAAGLVVGFATGRLPAGVTELHAQLALPGPHIVHNGAQVRLRGAPVALWPLAPAQTRTLIEACAEHGWYAELYIGDGFVVTDRRETARPHWEHVTGPPAGLVTDVDLEDVEVIKATLIATSVDEVTAMVAAVEALDLVAGPAGSPVTPGLMYVNVTSRDADKGRALVAAARELGVELPAVAAIGDGANDLSMLGVAGTAVAMGGSPPQVVAAAHLVAPAVGDDGVALALDALAVWAALP